MSFFGFVVICSQYDVVVYDGNNNFYRRRLEFLMNLTQKWNLESRNMSTKSKKVIKQAITSFTLECREIWIWIDSSKCHLDDVALSVGL